MRDDMNISAGDPQNSPHFVIEARMPDTWVPLEVWSDGVFPCFPTDENPEPGCTVGAILEYVADRLNGGDMSNFRVRQVEAEPAEILVRECREIWKRGDGDELDLQLYVTPEDAARAYHDAQTEPKNNFLVGGRGAPPIPENCPSCNAPWQGGFTLQLEEDGVIHFPEWLCMDCHVIANAILNSNRVAVVAEHLAEIGLLCPGCAAGYGALI